MDCFSEDELLLQNHPFYAPVHGTNQSLDAIDLVADFCVCLDPKGPEKDTKPCFFLDIHLLKRYSIFMMIDEREKNMTDLLTHLQTENAKTQAWINEDPMNRWAGLITEDLDHWASYGIHTVEDYEIYNFQATYSDMYKEAYGFRPRHDTSSWTKETWKVELDRVEADLEAEIEDEKAREEACVNSFKELVQNTIQCGAGDYDTALRWLTQEENFRDVQDVEQWVWNQGILFTDYGKEVLADLKNMYGM